MSESDFEDDQAGRERRPPTEKSGALTRAGLSQAVHRKTGLPRAECADCVEMVLSEIFEAIVAREDVKLSAFGAFILRAKKERQGRNPKTGVNAKIGARLVVSFRPSNILRARINDKDPGAA
jgi:integration host factor subunit alpha